jgi:DoxX-like family
MKTDTTIDPGESDTATVSKGTLWTGRIMSALAALFMLMDSVMKLMKPAPVLEAFAQLGYPESLAAGLGILQLVCVVIYVVPRTSILGAILLTGYLGGAIATHVRVGSPLFSHTLFPLYIALLIWGGLYLRDHRLRVALRAHSK